MRILLAGLVAALIGIRAVVAGFVLALLMLLRLLLAQMRLILLAMPGFAVIIVGAMSHECILLAAMIQPMKTQPASAGHVPMVARFGPRLCA